MKELLAGILAAPEFKELREHFKRGDQDLLTGLSGTQKSMVIAGLTRDLTGPALVISYHNNQAQRLALDLHHLLEADRVAFFPSNELFPHEEAYEPEVTAQRIETLGKILHHQNILVVTSWEALQRRLLPPRKLKEFTIVLSLGQDYDLNELLFKLTTMGYERVELVQAIGQFSRRGNILDIFPLDAHDPLRMEFEGDTIDSLRCFRVEDQLSTANLRETLVLPAREGLWNQADFELTAATILNDLKQQVSKLENLGRIEAAEALQTRVSEAVERLKNGQQLPGADQFLPWVEPGLVTLCDYLPDARVILDEPLRGRDAYRALAEETESIISSFLEKGVILPREQTIFLSAAELEERIERVKPNPWSLSLLAKTPKGFEPNHTLTLPFKTPPTFHSKVEQLAVELEQMCKAKQVVILAVATLEKARRLKEVLRERGVSSTLVSEGAEPALVPGMVRIEVANLESGLLWLPGQVLVLTETEIYGRQKKRVQARFQQEGTKISSFTDLKPGDYIVHLNHGIGRYVGIETLEINGGHRDYLRIEYAGEDRLFVPTDQVNLLQKYIGIEDASPKLNKLGGADWQKVKARVKESLRELSDALLALYAQREVAPGYAFSADTVWQHEFEEGFFFEETPDQLRSTAEIKQDMERPKPMDRLLCGDVGYGKTEVAMRAAFKAIMDGKQVGNSGTNHYSGPATF